ncbi:WS/DGAT domain-containing protein [Nonomuraea jabiensis]|uniref:WS/DGAT domain-containing protein n=1 Tax=Nonomuraea jabiensis TaxID=882448 RepID=UPI0036C7D7F1
MNILDSYYLDYEKRRPQFCAVISSLVRLRGIAPPQEDVAKLAAERIGSLPRLRSAPRWRTGRRPRLVPYDSFDIAEHLSTVAIAPGGQQQLHKVVGELLGQRLGASPPPWRLDVLSGYDPGEFALLLRFHHCLFDGLSATTVWQHLLGTARATSPALPSYPARTRGAVRGLISALATPPGPVLPLNDHADPHRRLILAIAGIPRAVLEEARDHASVLGRATLNDVYLAAVTGALRRTLLGTPHHRLPDTVNALVPVNTRPPQHRHLLGNHVSMIRASLPIGRASAAQRLADVHRAMSAAKRRNHAAGVALLAATADRMGDLGRSLVWRVCYHPRIGNLICSNVPIVTAPLALAGRPVTHMSATAALPHRHGLSVAMHGYGDHMTFSIVGDERLADLVHAFSSDLEEECRTLAGA